MSAGRELWGCAAHAGWVTRGARPHAQPRPWCAGAGSVPRAARIASRCFACAAHKAGRPHARPAAGATAAACPPPAAPPSRSPPACPRRFTEGIYVLYTYTAGPATGQAVQRYLSTPQAGNEQNILRHMTFLQ